MAQCTSPPPPQIQRPDITRPSVINFTDCEIIIDLLDIFFT